MRLTTGITLLGLETWMGGRLLHFARWFGETCPSHHHHRSWTGLIPCLDFPHTPCSIATRLLISRIRTLELDSLLRHCFIAVFHISVFLEPRGRLDCNLYRLFQLHHYFGPRARLADFFISMASDPSIAIPFISITSDPRARLATFSIFMISDPGITISYHLGPQARHTQQLYPGTTLSSFSRPGRATCFWTTRHRQIILRDVTFFVSTSISKGNTFR